MLLSYDHTAKLKLNKLLST